jgi:ketosteroid isomerase-like protein
MRRAAAFLAAAALAVACAPKPPTAEEIAREKAAVTNAIWQLDKAYSAKDTAGVLAGAPDSGAILYFGTDSAEVMRSRADYLAQMRADWALMDSVKFGPFRNIDVLMSANGDVASVVAEQAADAYVGKQHQHSFWRFARGLKKMNGRWVIVQSMPSVPTVGQSSAELVAKLHPTKR